jgi:hypothetical protein
MVSLQFKIVEKSLVVFVHMDPVFVLISSSKMVEECLSLLWVNSFLCAFIDHLLFSKQEI